MTLILAWLSPVFALLWLGAFAGGSGWRREALAQRERADRLAVELAAYKQPRGQA